MHFTIWLPDPSRLGRHPRRGRAFISTELLLGRRRSPYYGPLSTQI